MPVVDQDKTWAPHVACEHCKKTLEGWYREEKRSMKFVVPRIWCEPTDNSTSRYFCLVNSFKRRTGENVADICYPDLPSSIAPVPHSADLPVPTPPERSQPSEEESRNQKKKSTVKKTMISQMQLLRGILTTKPNRPQ
ncbi:uncharacterized protein [Cherax quadricarinatus]|uniref:uncharacterized protein n=1 Tax=Cherax quadricarinatus TaxID=27406 RepID=UPI00387E8B56